MGTFNFVYIPYDTSQDVQEQRMQYSPGKDIECLLEELRKRLQSGPAKHASARSAHGIYANAPTSDGSLCSSYNGPIKIVSSTALLRNTRANDYIGVNMYTDGSAAKLNLPENPRAQQLCRLCGQDQAKVQGDAWVARVFDDEDSFERLDFHSADLEASAPWIAMAAQQRIGLLRQPAQTILARIRAYCAENEAAQLREAEQQSMQQSAQKRQRTAAEAAQEQADAAFRAHNHAAAAEFFGKCAAAAGPQEEALRLTALGHRALAYLKLRHPAAALADCDTVLAAQPHHPTVLYRKAAACRALGRREDACSLLRQCVQLQPENKVAHAALRKLEQPPQQ
eukprot:jgi/Ulvmu1/1928/UM012_0088.1